MGTRKATLIRYSGPGRDGRFLAFVMRLLPTDSDRERLNSNKSCLRIAREFIPRPDVAAETMIERIDPPGPGGPPYSGLVVAGPLVFVAGQVGSDPRTGAVPAGIKAQTQVVLSNIEAKLKKAGCGLKDVVKSTVFLADIRGFEEMNEVYRTIFAPHFPARFHDRGAARPSGVPRRDRGHRLPSGWPPYLSGFSRPTRLGTTTPMQKSPRGPDDRGASPSIDCRPPSLVG